MLLIMGEMLTGRRGALPCGPGRGTGRLIGGANIVARRVGIMPGSLILGLLSNRGRGFRRMFRFGRRKNGQQFFNDTCLINAGAEYD